MKTVWKRLGGCFAVVLLLLSTVGCGTSTPEEETLTGTLDEVKDFLFVVTDDQDDSYAFPVDKKDPPEGLDTVTVGDRVTVTYTGELSVVDSFTGTVLSVKAAS